MRRYVTAYWRVLLAVFLSLLVLMFASPHVAAKSKESSAYFNAKSYLTWSGGVNGVSVEEMQVDNPGLADASTWGRSISLLSTYQDVTLGIEKDAGTTSGFFCFQPGLWFFISISSQIDMCYAVNKAVINTTCFFQINDYSSNGGGVEWWIQCGGLGPCENSCSWSYAPPAWNAISIVEQIKNTFTGHNVYGSYISGSKYQSTKGVWNWQPGPNSCPGQSGCPTASNPPQMYWEHYPTQVAGGDLFVCDYSSGSTCQYRN